MRQSQSTNLKEQSQEGEKDSLVTGSLWKAIWVMSWPLMLTTTSSSLVGLVDVQVSGRLGSSAQAAVGVSEQIVFLFLVFILATSTGTTALVSRAYGAKDQDEVERATGQSISLSFVMGLVLVCCALLVLGPSIERVATTPDVVALATSYMSIFSLLLIPFSITAIINAAFRAIGDAKTPLKIVAVITTINIAGDYLTVVGNWPVPGLGVKGIAISCLTASMVGSGLALAALYNSPLKLSFKKIMPLSKDFAVRILRIGMPSAFQRMGWAVSVFVLFFILRHCENPTSAIASWTIGMRIEGLIFMPLMALSLAVANIVGQNLGAKQPERAIKAGWQVTYIGMGMMVVLGLALFLFADPMAHIMSKDAATIGYARQYLQTNACAEPVLALSMVLTGALQGAGDTRAPMWITLFTNWIVRLPLAWLLAITFNLGPQGVWLAMICSITMSGLLTAWRFQSRTWLTTTV